MDFDPTTTTKFARYAWLFLLSAALILEVLTLPKGHRDTLSETIWDTVRWTPWRLVLLPAWTWLTWHWILRAPSPGPGLDARDILAVGIGLLWALWEMFYRK